jgi:hypothetical protein
MRGIRAQLRVLLLTWVRFLSTCSQVQALARSSLP